MSDTILVAVITLVGIIISGFISVVVSASLTNWRLKEIEKRLDSHNGYAQKFADASTDIELIKKDISYIKEKLKGDS